MSTTGHPMVVSARREARKYIAALSELITVGLTRAFGRNLTFLHVEGRRALCIQLQLILKIYNRQFSYQYHVLSPIVKLEWWQARRTPPDISTKYRLLLIHMTQ